MAQDPENVVLTPNTDFPASRPGLKTALIFFAVIAAIAFGIYWPTLKASLGF
ncbi:MAG TPA: hypothetical protein VFS04_05945 [Alphaproteobacteria bacterium]|nr:hypothetical protein [Alphaproteobacteria bacterium]